MAFISSRILFFLVINASVSFLVLIASVILAMKKRVNYLVARALINPNILCKIRISKTKRSLLYQAQIYEITVATSSDGLDSDGHMLVMGKNESS